MKRGHGIQLINDKKYNEIKNKFTKEQILNMIRDIFVAKYSE